MKFLPGCMSMADMILSQWNSDEGYNQGPLKKADFFLNSIFNTIDKLLVLRSLYLVTLEYFMLL